MTCVFRARWALMSRPGCGGGSCGLKGNTHRAGTGLHVGGPWVHHGSVPHGSNPPWQQQTCCDVAAPTAIGLSMSLLPPLLLVPLGAAGVQGGEAAAGKELGQEVSRVTERMRSCRTVRLNEGPASQ